MILKGATEAFEGGWNRVKLYFMLGLPTETEEDIKGIAELSNKIAAAYYETVPKEKRNGKVQIVASTSFFIPKPFTPFQWAAQCTKEQFIEKAYTTRRAISEQLNQKSIKYNWQVRYPPVLFLPPLSVGPWERHHRQTNLPGKNPPCRKGNGSRLHARKEGLQNPVSLLFR